MVAPDIKSFGIGLDAKRSQSLEQQAGNAQVQGISPESKRLQNPECQESMSHGGGGLPRVPITLSRS